MIKEKLKSIFDFDNITWLLLVITGFIIHHKRIILRVILIAGASFILIILLLFLFRNPIINGLARSKIRSFNEAHQAELKIGRIHLSGFSTFEVDSLSLRPIDGDTLFKTCRIRAKLGFFSLLLARINLKDFLLENTLINVVRNDSLNNYGFLIPKKKEQKRDTVITSTSPYNERVNRLFNVIFDKVPASIRIINFNCRYTENNHPVLLHIDDFSITDHRFKSDVIAVEDKDTISWVFEGRLDAGNRIAIFRWHGIGEEKVVIPYLKYKWGGDLAFDSITFSLYGNAYSNDVFTLKGGAAIHGFQINHPRISKEEVAFDNLVVQYVLHAGENYFEMDSLTAVQFNRLKLYPYLRYQPKPRRQVTLILNKKPFLSDELFESLPPGLFVNLRGIKTTGTLSYHLKCFVDIDHPDSVHVESVLKKKNFRIIHFGRTNFTMINDTFTYTAYEYGAPVRSFLVGPQNPNFRRLDQISPYLRSAVMTSEDGGFFNHNGFSMESIEGSVTANIKAKRFARGGSTISMQLVKNVFLNRNKTIARKLEEILIVWLMETNRLSSKERMYEVYLNIIEWGPMVYGAQEASMFYFNKDVSQLTLSEAIFLASIVPRPKWFMRSFENGRLKPDMAGYYRLVADKMLKKELISQEERDLLVPDVSLTGYAKDLLIRRDTIDFDTSEVLIVPKGELKQFRKEINHIDYDDKGRY
ncbi:MAG: hypothetical protein FJY10_04920 [Bacteroidetes bacterium]|nr:hypothetical protein [Bacteroidota bacterium]